MPLLHAFGLVLAVLSAPLAMCDSTEAPGPGVEEPPPAETPPELPPRTVSGRVVTAQGTPIAGALVWIEPSLTTGLVQTRTGADGRYRVDGLLNLPYHAKAWTEVAVNGEPFCLRLGMPNAADYDSFVPTAGVVRDFVWRLSGPLDAANGSYFGGEVRVFQDDVYDEPVELTFTPTGPLADGTAGQTVTQTLDSSTGLVRDVPLGPYRVTARFASGAPIRVGTDYAGSAAQQTEAAALAFHPAGGCSGGSGIARAFLHLNAR